jgi:UDPglucose 6-dehydrogenase
MEKRQISVIGIGYVGLSTAIGFTSKGYSVNAVDTDKAKIEKINKGILPFHEPHLQELFENAVKTGRLCCAPSFEKAIRDTSVTFVAVGTPSKPDGNIDLQYIETAVSRIGNALKKKDTYHLVVVKSTVTPTTTENSLRILIEKHSGKVCGLNFGLCMSPEFLREGSALSDFLHPDRIIIGEFDKKSGDTLEELFKEFYYENLPTVVRTNLSTAELIKYASNAFLGTKISFINTMASICEKIPKADVELVAKGIGLDRRIGPLFLNAGLGYGGSCFPKDIKALIAYSKTLDYKPELLESVENVNKIQPLKAIELCKELLTNLKDAHIAVLGLAFKPNTDDMREAVSIPIINQLLKEGATVTAYDPEANSNAKKIFKNKIKYASSAIGCLKGADCCIIVTEWAEVKKLKPDDYMKNMRHPIIVDGRRIHNPDDFKKQKYVAIGLGPRQ